MLLALTLVAAACGGETTASLAIEEDAATAEATSAPVEQVDTVEEAPAEEAPAEEAEVVSEDAEVEDEPLAEEVSSESREVLIAELTEALEGWRSTGGIPGASLSVRMPEGDPINITVGVSDLQTGAEVEVDDYFRIGSITKPMTSAVILQLVDEGLLELDEPVETYLPGWLDGYQYADVITIRQLLDHTNGLIEYAFDPEFYAQASARSDQAISSAEIRAFLATREPLFAPGSQYSYETGGFLTLGDVIEELTGNTAAEEMRARIFAPAGAENIFLAPQEFPPEQVVNAYGRAELYIAGTLLVGREDTDKLTIESTVRPDDPVIDVLGQPQDVLQSAGWTGGGIEAQLESVSAAFGALFDGTILTEAQIAEMTTTVLDVNYGLGIDNAEVDGERVYSHGGGVPGFRSQANYLPDYDISWAVSANLIPLPEGATVGDLRLLIQPILVNAAG